MEPNEIQRTIEQVNRANVERIVFEDYNLEFVYATGDRGHLTYVFDYIPDAGECMEMELTEDDLRTALVEAQAVEYMKDSMLPNWVAPTPQPKLQGPAFDPEYQKKYPYWH